MYMIRNNVTGKSYLLLGAVAVQEDENCTTFSSDVAWPEYTHGVLLYCMSSQTLLAVPYHILQSEYYDEVKDTDAPVWQIEPNPDNNQATPLQFLDWAHVQGTLEQSADYEADCFRAWLNLGRWYTPLVPCGVYRHKTDPQKVLQLPKNGMFDKTNNSDNASIFMFLLNTEGKVQYPVWVSLRELFTEYQLITNGKEPTNMYRSQLDDLFSISSSSSTEGLDEAGCNEVQRTESQADTTRIEQALGLTPLSVYYCAKDKVEYTYIQMVPASAIGDSTMLALFAPRVTQTESPFPIVGLVVDTNNLSQTRERLFEHKDYGDGVFRPYLTYIGTVGTVQVAVESNIRSSK